jgi:hypothetical protein
MVAALAALVAAIFALTVWGGLPATDERTAFVISIGVMIAFALLFTLLGWHLLFRPLPAGHKVPTARSLTRGQLQLLASLLGVSAVSLIVGAFWDEVWHRQYGIPFGQDFFWRPHLLMYFSFLLVVILAFGGLYLLMKQGKGTLQQRFRANPLLGLLVIVCGFVLYVIPADPLWHAIYGKDLSAWSIPHTLLAISFTSIMILTAAVQLSTLPLHEWTSILKLRFSEVLPVIAIAFSTMFLLQLLTAEWDQISSVSASLRSRPEWILPANIMVVAALVATLANHAIRRVGTATLVGLLALGFRALLVSVFQFEGVSANMWLVLLPPMVAIDVWYAIRLYTGRAAPSWISSALAGAVGMIVVSFPVINRLLFYPQISQTNLLPMSLAVIVASVGASWFGRNLGDYLALGNKSGETAIESTPERSYVFVSVAGLLAILMFIGLFIGTAVPPV